MSISLSLANKYRPQTFDQMIGQQHIIGILKAKMQSNCETLQNYLLTGPRGTGKTSSARILAKAINCLNPHDGNPCNQCTNCIIINEGTSLDYVEIDAASHTGVDNIREEILDKALYPPTALKKKIYVIDEVHMLSKGAFNSLLKTIEEPKGNVCFILATTEIHKVPDTIISRSQVFNFKKVSDEEIIANLAHICKKEGFSYDKEALALIATISDGGVRDSVKYLDQISILGTITQENVSKFLGISSEASIKTFLETIKKGERNLIFQAIEQINKSGIDLHQFAKQVVGFIDKHLLEDTDFYLKVSEVFGNILRQIRFYPYPAVIYKVELSKGCKEVEQQQIIPEITSSGIKEVSGIIKKEPSDEQKMVKQSLQQEDLTSGTATTSGTETNEPTNNEPTLHDEQLTNTEDQEKNTTALRKTVLDKLSKPTVQSNLKDHVIIERIEDTAAHLIVTNKIAEMLLQNPDTKKEIETLLSSELGMAITVSFTFETKEEFFARTLGE